MKSYPFATAVAISGIALTSIAMAQNADEGFTLEEVIVTAERREENLQKVAATVTAISATVLQEQGVKDITDLTRVAPQLQIQAGAFQNITQRGISTGQFGPISEGTTAVHINGAYISRFTGLNGMIFDTQRVEILDGPQGTLYGRNATAGTINVITARPGDTFGGDGSIEFGNYNLLSVNGAWNFPISDTIKTRVAFYSTSRKGYYAAGTDDQELNAGRFSLEWKPTERDSVFFMAMGSRVGGKGGSGGNIIENFERTPTVCRNSTTGIVSLPNPTTPNGPIPCVGGTLHSVGTAAYNDAITTSDLHLALPEHPWDNRPTTGWNGRDAIDTRNNALVLNWDHDFGFATLVTSISNQDTSTNNVSGYTTEYSHDPRLYTAGFLRPGGANYLPAHAEWNSAEMHLASNGNGQLRWMAGLYYFYENSYDNGNGSLAVCYPLGANSNNPANQAYCPGGTGFPPPSVQNGNVTGYGQSILLRNVDGDPIVQNDYYLPHNTTNAKAGFGQATWTPNFAPRLHLTGGARYNWERRFGSGAQILNRVLSNVIVWSEEETWTETTYKVNAAFDISDDIMVYADRSTGFKAGGIGFGINPQFEPETLEAWEIGAKNRFFDGKLQVNLAGWYYTYEGRTIQSSDYIYDYNDTDVETVGPENDPIGSSTTPSSVNAGSLVSKGQSIDLTFVPTPNDQLRLNVQHVDTIYTDYDLTSRRVKYHAFDWCTATPTGETPAGGCVGDDYYNPAPPNPAVPNTVARVLNLVPTNVASQVFTGTRQGPARPWSGNASYTHTFHFLQASWAAQITYLYQGSIDNVGAVGTNANLLVQPSYWSSDLSLRYTPNDSNWNVLFWARNFQDRDYTVTRSLTWSNTNAVPYYTDPRAVTQSNWAYWQRTVGNPVTYGVTFNARF